MFIGVQLVLSLSLLQDSTHMNNTVLPIYQSQPIVVQCQHHVGAQAILWMTQGIVLALRGGAMYQNHSSTIADLLMMGEFILLYCVVFFYRLRI